MKLNKAYFTKQGEFSDLLAFKENNGERYIMKMLPDPPGKVPLPDHVKYDASTEPKFDPKVHLNLENPSEVTINVNNSGFKSLPGGSYRALKAESEYAYCSPFQVFSEEGARVGRSILSELKKSASNNGRQECFRGIWYLSPFFKDLMLCQDLLAHFETICGEPVLPHFYLMNPQINIGKVGKKVSKGTIQL